MGYCLVSDVLVFSEASLALYEALIPGGHRFRLRCREASLPQAWLLPGYDTLVGEDLLPEDEDGEPERVGAIDVVGLAGSGALAPVWHFEAAGQAIAALVSLGGPAVLLTDETHAGIPSREVALAFSGGVAIGGGGDEHWRGRSWGWSREQGAVPAPRHPIADTAAMLVPELKGAFLFDRYLPRNTDRGIISPAPAMTLPDVSPLLAAWSPWGEHVRPAG